MREARLLEYDEAELVVPDGTAPPGELPAAVFAAAADAYACGRRLDMQSLARRLGVARATLYRQAGKRGQLLDQVLWWRGRLLLSHQVRATANPAGVPRITAVIAGVLHAIERDRALRTFLEADPEAALRILT